MCTCYCGLGKDHNNNKKVQVVLRGTPVTKTVVQLGDQTLKYQVEIKPLWPTNLSLNDWKSICLNSDIYFKAK